MKEDSGTCRAKQYPAEKESQIEEDQAEQSPSNIVVGLMGKEVTLF